MEDTYYTPKLHEYHVGFECEIATINNNWVVTGWRKKTVEVSDELTLFGSHPNLYRVKYLDKEDFEELEATHYKDGEDGSWWFELANLLIIYDYETKIIKIVTRDPSKNEKLLKTTEDPNIIGGMKILNKTELKALISKLEKDEQGSI